MKSCSGAVLSWRSWSTSQSSLAILGFEIRSLLMTNYHSLFIVNCWLPLRNRKVWVCAKHIDQRRESGKNGDCPLQGRVGYCCRERGWAQELIKVAALVRGLGGGGFLWNQHWTHRYRKEGRHVPMLFISVRHSLHYTIHF